MPRRIAETPPLSRRAMTPTGPTHDKPAQWDLERYAIEPLNTEQRGIGIGAERDSIGSPKRFADKPSQDRPSQGPTHHAFGRATPLLRQQQGRRTALLPRRIHKKAQLKNERASLQFCQKLRARKYRSPATLQQRWRRGGRDTATGYSASRAISCYVRFVPDYLNSECRHTL